MNELEFSDEELEQVDRAVSDFLNPYLNPMIRGAEPDDDGIPEMKSAWEKIIEISRNDTKEDAQ